MPDASCRQWGERKRERERERQRKSEIGSLTAQTGGPVAWERESRGDIILKLYLTAQTGGPVAWERERVGGTLYLSCKRHVRGMLSPWHMRKLNMRICMFACSFYLYLFRGREEAHPNGTAFTDPVLHGQLTFSLLPVFVLTTCRTR